MAALEQSADVKAILRRRRQDRLTAPPDHELGRPVTVPLLVARNDEVAVAFSAVAAFSNGAQLTLDAGSGRYLRYRSPSIPMQRSAHVRTSHVRAR